MANIREQSVVRKCNKCFEAKTLDNFYNSARTICKSCRSIIASEYRAKNKERITKVNEIYRSKPDIALKSRWRSMMSRCYNRKDISYHRYGGRGIEVCSRWHNYKNFIGDMRNGFNINLQLDRIDNSKNYSPQNCKWSSKKEQARNRRNNRPLTFNGETLLLTDWAKRLGIARQTLWVRIDKMGWSLEKALTKGRI